MGAAANENAAGNRGGDAGSRSHGGHGQADEIRHDGRRHRGAAGPSQDSESRLVGHSFGGATAIRAAIQHRDKVRRLVVISSPYARSGWYPETQEGMGRISAAMAENMVQTPTGQLSQQWPEPQRFPQSLDKMGRMMSEDYDWSADIAKLQLPVLLVFADNDSISRKHVAQFFALLGGGVTEPG